MFSYFPDVAYEGSFLDRIKVPRKCNGSEFSETLKLLLLAASLRRSLNGSWIRLLKRSVVARKTLSYVKKARMGAELRVIRVEIKKKVREGKIEIVI